MSRTQTIPGKWPAMFRGHQYGPGPAVVPDDFPSEAEYKATLDKGARTAANLPLTVSDAQAARGSAEGDAMEATAQSLGGDPNEKSPEELETQIEKEKREAKKAQEEAEREAEKAEREAEKKREADQKQQQKEAEERLKAEQKAAADAEKGKTTTTGRKAGTRR